jgi:transcriptional regulator with XRE-family HTH domain
VEIAASRDILFWDIWRTLLFGSRHTIQWAAAMPRSSRSPRQARLQELLSSRRVAAELTQEEVALRLRRPQSFVSKYESGERRLDVVEFVEVADAIGFDVRTFIADLLKEPPT